MLIYFMKREMNALKMNENVRLLANNQQKKLKS